MIWISPLYIAKNIHGFLDFKRKIESIENDMNLTPMQKTVMVRTVRTVMYVKHDLTSTLAYETEVNDAKWIAEIVERCIMEVPLMDEIAEKLVEAGKKRIARIDDAKN